MSHVNKTKQQLQREIVELKAQMASSYALAGVNLAKVSDKNLMGSGVLLELSFIGGKDAISPVMIHNGLSPATIDAIRLDLIASHKLLSFKA